MLPILVTLYTVFKKLKHFVKNELIIKEIFTKDCERVRNTILTQQRPYCLNTELEVYPPKSQRDGNTRYRTVSQANRANSS